MCVLIGVYWSGGNSDDDTGMQSEADRPIDRHILWIPIVLIVCITTLLLSALFVFTCCDNRDVHHLEANTIRWISGCCWSRYVLNVTEMTPKSVRRVWTLRAFVIASIVAIWSSVVMCYLKSTSSLGSTQYPYAVAVLPVIVMSTIHVVMCLWWGFFPYPSCVEIYDHYRVSKDHNMAMNGIFIAPFCAMVAVTLALFAAKMDSDAAASDPSVESKMNWYFVALPLWGYQVYALVCQILFFAYLCECCNSDAGGVSNREQGEVVGIAIPWIFVNTAGVVGSVLFSYYLNLCDAYYRHHYIFGNDSSNALIARWIVPTAGLQAGLIMSMGVLSLFLSCCVRGLGALIFNPEPPADAVPSAGNQVWTLQQTGGTRVSHGPRIPDWMASELLPDEKDAAAKLPPPPLRPPS